MTNRKNLLLWILFFCLLTSRTVTSEAKQTMSELMAETILKLMDVYDIPGVSVALVSGGELVWSQGFGWADSEEATPMTSVTRCRVQSISKPVTAWGVMHLVKNGVVELDTPVAQYITSWSSESPQWQDTTIRHLLTHQSGLPIGDVMDQYAPWASVPSVRDSLSREAQWDRNPGGAFAYSNLGYNLLEVLIEDVTGIRFAQYMEETVLLPLGMASASFNWSEDFDPPIPTGYNFKGDPVPVYVYPGRASGGLFATAVDVAHFLIAGMGKNPVLDESLVQAMYEPDVEVSGIYSLISPSYGLGYFIESLQPGVRAVWHGGQGNGLMTHFHAIPETGDALVVLTNSQRSWPFMGALLRLWSDELGVEAPGMSIVARGEHLLQVLSALLVFLVLGALICIDMFGQSTRYNRARVVFQLGVGSALILLVVWSLGQDYLFVTSVFPRGAEWLGWALLIIGAACIISSARQIRKTC